MMRNLIVAMLLLFSFPSWAESNVPGTAYESVQESTDLLLTRLVEVQPIYESEPDKFFAEVEDALEPYIDFGGFAKRVMAKHYRAASPEQRAAFVGRFKESLIRTYATALIEFDNEEVIVIAPTTPQKTDDRATIMIEVHAKSGTIYPVQYQLELNEERRWMLRNVIINGINIGLQFRSQFNAYMQKYKKNVDKVIENWSVDVEDKA
jgi:phospholipid transport system substrate-binding protein